MKKWIIIVFSLVTLYVVTVLAILSSDRNLTIKKQIQYPGNAVVRLLHDKVRFNKCWPGENKNNNLTYREAFFQLDEELINGIALLVDDDGNKIYGRLEVVGMENSQCELTWTSDVKLSGNPFLRPVNYLQFQSISKKLNALMEDLSVSYNKMKTLYGSTIEKIRIEESSMISTNKEFDHVPSNEEVYEMVASIEKFIADNHGHSNGSPMLNINTEDSIHYMAMTALPTLEEIQGAGNFKLKKMMKGNMLRMKITGGVDVISEAGRLLHFYVEDHRKTPAAIPFETMITNRMQVADSSKWITELYYPVFY